MSTNFVAAEIDRAPGFPLVQTVRSGEFSWSHEGTMAAGSPGLVSSGAVYSNHSFGDNTWSHTHLVLVDEPATHWVTTSATSVLTGPAAQTVAQVQQYDMTNLLTAFVLLTRQGPQPATLQSAMSAITALNTTRRANEGLATVANAVSYSGAGAAHTGRVFFNITREFDSTKVQSEKRTRLSDAITRAFLLESGWAGPDSVGPSVHTAEIARQILSALPEGLLPESVSPSGDGGIGLFWRRSKGGIDMLIDSDGFVVWLVRVDGKLVPGSELRFDGELPYEFFNSLATIF